MASSYTGSLNSRHRPTASKTSHSRQSQFHPKRAIVTDDDAYNYALRAAYLNYLLQPRQKRIQHVANTSKPIQRSSTSINEVVAQMRDSKSTKLPHSFPAELEKRVTGVLYGKEKMPEYNDPLIKRTFAAFLNEFKNPIFRKSVEKDRKVEDLLLIFFSKATAELQKGKGPEDETWKLLVDRHVALFVRIISSTLQSNEWSKDRPELSAKLKTLEQKLLQHDQDIAEASRNSGSTSIEVEIPRSYEVRDMPMVIRVCRIFAKSTAQAQGDINAHKNIWTEQAALKDLKEYQNNMMLNTRVTLTKNDFDLDDAYETWKKGEFTALSQMILAILKNNPELAKTSAGATDPSTYKTAPISPSTDSGYGDISKILASQDAESSLVFGQPVDMSGLNLDDNSPTAPGNGVEAAQVNFTFIPPDPRSYYRRVLMKTLTHDLEDQAETAAEASPTTLLSKQSSDVLYEIAQRWRVPASSRSILFLDVVREKYQEQEVSLETVDNAFLWLKQPPSPPKKPSTKAPPQQPLSLLDRGKWIVQDYALNQTILSSLHDTLLRELFDLFQQCYENKPPSIGSIMYVLENHIYDDELFTKEPEDLDAFSVTLADALKQKARNKYYEILAKNVSEDANVWEFYNVIQLGQAVTALSAKIQKRYRKNPEVMGVNPLTILVEEVLPSFADDARALVKRILEVAKKKNEEIAIQDGFDLYRELVEIRRVHAQALPGRAFGFQIEELLQVFVWRWIETSETKFVEWVEGAVQNDNFQVRQDPKEKEQGLPPTDEERHSLSAADIFVIFSQSIEILVKLEWDDDLQYAKFMTTISKSVGRGIARYCELLEAMFTKEMDRQTPEQEMRAQQTQRDRWINYARDFYQTGGKPGEKIELFQFWPQSFVKINDIEYATLQLDKLEKEVNVDACAEVINRREPPQTKRNLQSNYMFTIKIVEAEDLRAGDVNGLSDPYVILGDEWQKRLAKTRTVYQSLNPRWDESVDIMTTSPLNLIVTVWDWDLLGDHDCLGRTNLKLDPNHFNDFVPREYWLDLDTQGRVLVRVSMEGERDDIQFYFGKAFRALKKTQKEMTRKTSDKLSAYIHSCLSRRTLKALLSLNATIGGVSISNVKGYFSKAISGRPGSVASPPPQAAAGPTQAEVAGSLKPLLNYFDENFAIMKMTLTESAMISVMTRLWKEVLVTIEGLLVPPLSDKPSSQRSLNQQEVDIVYKWLQMLFDFFHAVDETGEALGVPLDILKSPKYHDLQNLNFFYFESTNNLIRTSESMAAATAQRQQEAAARLNRLSAPSMHIGGMLTAGAQGTRRTKSVMMSRNLGTMRKAKEEKRKEAQADPNDDMILRILRMRPEAERYLKDRSRQKDRLAAAAAAEAIVRQSLQASKAAQSSGAGLGRRWDTIRE